MNQNIEGVNDIDELYWWLITELCWRVDVYLYVEYTVGNDEESLSYIVSIMRWMQLRF